MELLLSGWPALPPSPACPPTGFYNGSVRVFIDFEGSDVPYNNLGDSGGPLVNLTFVQESAFFQNGGDPAFPPQGIYFSKIGKEVVYDEEITDGVDILFDMYVVNRTRYVPNIVIRNGERGTTGDFGALNLADGQSFDFDFLFVRSSDGTPYTIGQPYSIYFFDFDHGEDGQLLESLSACGLSGYRTSVELYGVETTVSVKIEDSERGCYSFTATQKVGGENNPLFSSEIFVPIEDISSSTQADVLPYLAELQYPGGSSTNSFTFSVSAA
eukprot:6213384-Pleurochrysis_carterae.AAC.1